MSIYLHITALLAISPESLARKRKPQKAACATSACIRRYAMTAPKEPQSALTAPIDPSQSGAQLSSEMSTATPTKRKRASKPKARTGCLTCRIRRVKCDESKPSCTRCVSTGRTCDGYGAPQPRRRRHPSSPSTDLRTPRIPPPAHRRSPPAPRPLAAAIPGTERERRSFHNFRRLAETGLALHAARARTGFWAHVVPRVGATSAAVRHAAIALGAAWEGMQLRKRAFRHHNYHQYYRDDYAAQMEAFTLQQYNRAIAHLRNKGEDEGEGGRVEVTLLCCLLFICLETSRGDSAATLSHVASGLRIVAALPTDVLRFSSGTSVYTRGSGPCRLERSDWRHLLDLFLGLEFATAPHWASHQSLSPNVAMGAHALGRLIDATMPAAWSTSTSPSTSASPSTYTREEITSLEAAHRTQQEWCAHALRRIWETLPHKGDTAFWAQASQQRQQAILVARGRRVLRLLSTYLRTLDPLTTTPTTATTSTTTPTPTATTKMQARNRCGERYSVLMDLMQMRILAIVVSGMPYLYGRAHFASLFLAEARELIATGERLVFLLRETQSSGEEGKGKEEVGEVEMPDLVIEPGVLVVMRAVVYAAVDPELRRRGLAIVKVLGGVHETIYQGDVLVRLFEGYDGNAGGDDDLAC
ncbi:hypothetical protein F5B20DRAFT_565982 [Whalleya microplaca]|nr:hypothetical protein F5B20DRAFT_565982 [Whalleya microplaca]